jgi:hypothetical protein
MSPLLQRGESAARPRDERIQFAHHKGKSAHISISSALSQPKKVALLFSERGNWPLLIEDHAIARAVWIAAVGGVAHKKSSQTIKSFICAVPQSGCLAGQR